VVLRRVEAERDGIEEALKGEVAELTAERDALALQVATVAKYFSGAAEVPASQPPAKRKKGGQGK
jgi:hypothetical protein